MAARGERAHEQAVAGLAQRVVLEQPPRRALGAGELGAAEPRQAATYASSARSSVSSSRRRQASSQGRSSWPASSGRSATYCAHSAALQARAQSPCDDRGLGAVHGGERRLDVDPRIGGRVTRTLAAPSRTPAPTAARSFDSSTVSAWAWFFGGVAGPERLGQLVAAGLARALEHEVGEQRAALPAREAVLDAAPAELDHEAAAQLDVGLRRVLQPRSNV